MDATRASARDIPEENIVSRAFLIGTLVLSLSGCASRGWIPQAPADFPGEQQAGQPVPSASPASPAPSASPAPLASPTSAKTSATAYTQATRHGDLWFLSGQIGEGPDISSQTQAAMEKITSILRERGLNSANIVQVTVHITHLRELAGFEQVYESFFRSTLPARTVIAVDSLPRNALVQITVIAGR
jgi:2-iminobutanoate/2-iminopropanoate deaminase